MNMSEFYSEFLFRYQTDKDLKSEKDDFGGSNPSGGSCEDLSTPVTPEKNNTAPLHPPVQYPDLTVGITVSVPPVWIML